MKRMFTYCLLAGAVVLLAAAVVDTKQAVPDTELGLSKTSVFVVADPDPVHTNTSDPGDLPVLPRAFRGSPPTIPHGIGDFVPIRQNDNQCMDCHLVEKKVEGEPTPIPRDHFIDFRNAPGEVGSRVVGARYVCVTCHVAPTATGSLVENLFEP